MMNDEKKKTMMGPKDQVPKAFQDLSPGHGYNEFLGGISSLLAEARKQAGRVVNTILTATYWELGRRIVEYELGGKERAVYGEKLIERLSDDLTARFGKGFSQQNLHLMRQFYLAYPPQQIFQTVSGELADSLELSSVATAFPLSWSHYVLLISRSRSEEARFFYHAEALRGGWSVRQLQRQIDSQFYERVALSKNKSALLQKESGKKKGKHTLPEEAIKDPYVLEFLGLKDEYSESDLEEALIR